LWKNWTGEGVLREEADPAVYVYHQQFEHEGQQFLRRGMLCAVHLEHFGQGDIYPHEETHAGPKEDRLRLLRSVQVKLSPIFGLYPDPTNECQELLEAAVAGQAPLEATDDAGVVHRMWAVTDVAVIASIRGCLAGRPVFVADGHHRYETACTYRDELSAKGELDPDHPAQRTLMFCVGLSDPGMIVLPTHRLFRGMPEMTADQLTAKLEGCFEVEPSGHGPDQAVRLWSEIEAEGTQGTLGLYTYADQRWLLARVTAAGRQRLKQVAPDHSDQWRSLGVSILHSLIIETLLSARDLPKPMYVHEAEAVSQFLHEGDSVGRDHTGQQGSGGAFQLAALVMPATVGHVRAISEAGERMPAKSTYFYPKALSGLVAYRLT
jgi:uncharacterized protein (DUF1015 family)